MNLDKIRDVGTLSMVADVQKAVGPKARVFISYSRKDMAFTDRLEGALKERGFEPLIDRSEIYAFEDWWKRIEALIAQSDTVVFVLSPDALASEVALREIGFAASLNKRFAPIVCRRVEAAAMPEAVAKLNFIFFDNPASFDESIRKLAEALTTDIGWVRQHTEFGEQARRWVATRANGLLLRSSVLEDAERWIAARPTNAPEPTDETQAFVRESRRAAMRRRNLLTGSLAAGLVVALVLAAVAYWQRGLAVEQERAANEQRQLAEQQRRRAEDTLAAATKTANDLVFDFAIRFRDTGIPTDLVKDLLDRARGLQDELAKAGGTTPALRRSQAGALAEMSETLLAIGDLQGALTAAEHSRDIIAGLVASNAGNTGWQLDLAVSQSKLGDVQYERKDWEAALASYRAALAIVQRLVQSNPNDDLWQRSLALAYIRVGDVQRTKGEFASALSSYRDSLFVIERLAKSAPNDRERQRDLSVAYERIGWVQQLQGDFAGALKSFRDGLVIAETLAKAAPRDANGQRDLALAHSEVGEAQFKQGDLNAALVSLSASVAIMDRVVKSDPGNAHWMTSLRIFIGKLGRLSYEFLLARDFERALRAADDAISHAPEETRIYTNRYRAHALMFLGRHDEARAIYLEYRGKKVPGMVWETVISRDFGELRKAGLTSPLMGEVEEAFKSTK